MLLSGCGLPRCPRLLTLPSSPLAAAAAHEFPPPNNKSPCPWLPCCLWLLVVDDIWSIIVCSSLWWFCVEWIEFECNGWKLCVWLAAVYNWLYNKLAGRTGYRELLQLLLPYDEFWDPIRDGKFVLFVWLCPMFVFEFEVSKSSWTGDSGCELLSLRDRGPVDKL